MPSTARASSLQFEEPEIIRTDEVNGCDAGSATGGISSLLDLGRRSKPLRPTFSQVVKLKTRRDVGKIYRAAWAAGCTAKEAAKAVGVTVASAYSYGARHGLTWAKDNSHRYDARRAEYMACWKAGMTAEQAAAKIGVVRGAAYGWANINGIRWATPHKNRYRECLDAGMSLAQASEALGVKSHILQAWARRNGVRFIGTPTKPPTQSRLTKLLTDAELRDYNYLCHRYKYSTRDALVAIKRADLLPRGAP